MQVAYSAGNKYHILVLPGGYLLAFVGFILLKVDSLWKGAAIVAATAIVVVGVQTFTGEDSSINKLILERLERDESQGIKGNNRFSATRTLCMTRR